MSEVDAPRVWNEKLRTSLVTVKVSQSVSLDSKMLLVFQFLNPNA